MTWTVDHDDAGWTLTCDGDEVADGFEDADLSAELVELVEAGDLEIDTRIVRTEDGERVGATTALRLMTPADRSAAGFAIGAQPVNGRSGLDR